MGDIFSLLRGPEALCQDVTLQKMDENVKKFWEPL
jgi:hypothetical protein